MKIKEVVRKILTYLGFVKKEPIQPKVLTDDEIIRKYGSIYEKCDVRLKMQIDELRIINERKKLQPERCCYCKNFQRFTGDNKVSGEANFCNFLEDVISVPRKFVCNKFEASQEYLKQVEIAKLKRSVDFREVEE